MGEEFVEAKGVFVVEADDDRVDGLVNIGSVGSTI